ncbi:MAG: type 2 lantipeptide synthetase LanM, partial [Anaerolineales bacterium]|nr:type 2 lantipeptide synthetase LanM [Anaerolineales bacterium]
MNPSTTTWQPIIHRAAFLPERLTGWQNAAQSPRRGSSAWLTRWRDLLGGEAQLAERLGWLGLDVVQAEALLQEGQLTAWLAPAQQPPWAAVLTEALTQSAPLVADELEIIAPFLAIAEPLAQPHLAGLAPAAQQSVRDYLAGRLRDWVTPTVQQVGMYPLPALCLRYPVLGRQLAVTVLQWMAEVAAFNQRVTADWSALTEIPFTEEAITAVQPNLSDPHNGGRTVWRVTLADGQTLAYKPKNIDLDHAWQQLLRWLNEQGLTPALTPLWTLPRPDYGWMAWVEAEPSPPTDPHYGRRTGLLLGLFHLLHATDLHDENLIHGRGHPHLVDGEMLLYPQVAGQFDSLDLLRTGALSTWFVTRRGVADLSGLGGMVPLAQLPDVAAGYAQLMAFAATHEAELWADEGPLAQFQRGRVRFTARPTMAYDRLLTHLRQPAFLVSGAAFSVELDSLARAYLSTPEQKRFHSLLMAEQAAVAQGDVPFFAAHSGQPDLSHSHGTLPNFLVWPPIQLPTPIAQQQQQAYIRESL